MKVSVVIPRKGFPLNEIPVGGTFIYNSSIYLKGSPCGLLMESIKQDELTQMSFAVHLEKGSVIVLHDNLLVTPIATRVVNEN